MGPSQSSIQSFKLPDPPPSILKVSDLVVIPDLNLKEWITGLEDTDTFLNIELMSKDYEVRFNKETKIYYQRRANNIPKTRWYPHFFGGNTNDSSPTFYNSWIQINNIWFFTKITPELCRDVNINSILE